LTSLLRCVGPALRDRGIAGPGGERMATSIVLSRLPRTPARFPCRQGSRPNRRARGCRNRTRRCGAQRTTRCPSCHERNWIDTGGGESTALLLDPDSPIGHPELGHTFDGKFVIPVTGDGAGEQLQLVTGCGRRPDSRRVCSAVHGVRAAVRRRSS
jgi:hypothetical protein